MSMAVVKSTECPLRQAAWPNAIDRCVGVGRDEGEAEQVLDLRTVDLSGPAPLGVLEGLEHGEARVPDAALDAAVLTQHGLAFFGTYKEGNIRFHSEPGGLRLRPLYGRGTPAFRLLQLN
jgi:hypothetical protein